MTIADTIWKDVDKLLHIAIAEDIGSGDVTSQLVLPKGTFCQAVFASRESGISAGITVVKRLYSIIDSQLRIIPKTTEGNPVQPGDCLAEISGSAQSILSGERIALNLLQRMSGIATLTHKYVKAIEGSKAKIVDTRKTVPGWRKLDKLAVYLGGGINHREGLFDMILIKDNHLALAGSNIATALDRAKVGSKLKIEIEVDTIEQLKQALAKQPDMILLDNLDAESLTEAVHLAAKICAESGLAKPLMEASGGITLKNVAAISKSGVDRISIGALTHSCQALDIGLDIAI